MIAISRIDHIVLTVKDIPTTLEFYTHVLGMHATRFAASDGSERIALEFGKQKINLHQVDKEFSPHAKQPTPGSADLCLITEIDLQVTMAYVRECNIEIIEGPIKRNGATGKLLSFYIHDPDSNLIEISNTE